MVTPNVTGKIISGNTHEVNSPFEYDVTNNKLMSKLNDKLDDLDMLGVVYKGKLYF